MVFREGIPLKLSLKIHSKINTTGVCVCVCHIMVVSSVSVLVCEHILACLLYSEVCTAALKYADDLVLFVLLFSYLN